jgi:hypothetical protein
MIVRAAHLSPLVIVVAHHVYGAVLRHSRAREPLRWIRRHRADVRVRTCRGISRLSETTRARLVQLPVPDNASVTVIDRYPTFDTAAVAIVVAHRVYGGWWCR